MNLLHALTEPLPEEMSGAEADLRLDDLKACALRVVPRIDEAEDARAHVRLAHHDKQPDRRYQEEAAAERARPCARGEENGAGHHGECDRSPEVRLEQD